MPHKSGLTCIHQADGNDGLCPECAEDYELDPLAYHEYGCHAAGMVRWEALQRAIEEQMGAPAIPGVTNDNLPF